MSQTVVPAAPAGGPAVDAADALDGPVVPAAPSGTFQGRIQSAWAQLQHSLSGTPGRLRIVSGVCVLAALLIAVGGGAALHERSAAISEASAASAHLILLQGVQTNLVQADADATNSFLGFGLEPLPQRQDYIASIQAASRDLAVAADASPQDGAALGAANAELTRYTGYISSARANNRLGKPVGANYLSTASDLLNQPKTGIIAELTSRSEADHQKIDSAYSRAAHAALWLALVVVVGVGTLIGAQVYLSRRSRRLLNLPLAAATVGVIVAVIVAAAAMAVAESKANDVRHGALAQATDLSNSRVAAFSAKSSESLTLIARGSATSQDAEWAALMKTATTLLPPGNATASDALSDYAKEHATINKLDVVEGNWNAAVKQAIAPGTTTANGRFAVYAQQTETALTTQAHATASGLDKAGNTLLPAGILMVLMGLLAAVGAWWGVTLRLDEYR